LKLTGYEKELRDAFKEAIKEAVAFDINSSEDLEKISKMELIYAMEDAFINCFEIYNKKLLQYLDK